jgi:hypothetical protein
MVREKQPWIQRERGAPNFEQCIEEQQRVQRGVCDESYRLRVIRACTTDANRKLKNLLRELSIGELPIASDDRKLTTRVASRATYAQHGFFVLSSVSAPEYSNGDVERVGYWKVGTDQTGPPQNMELNTTTSALGRNKKHLPGQTLA